MIKIPIGLALFGWTNKEGFFLIDGTPSEIRRLLDDETVMRIGSLHRLRKLDPNFLTLTLPNFKVASFFSGMKTAKYIITPNFTLTLLLEIDENPHKYSAILPTAAKEVLRSLSGEKQRFDSRIARMGDVLAAIGEEYKQVLPRVFRAICNNEIQNALSVDELLDEAGYAEVEISEAEKEIQKLKEIINEKDGVIDMLQKMIAEQEKKGDTFGPTLSDYTSMVQDLQTKLSESNRINRELQNKCDKLEAQLEKAPLIENKLRVLQADLRERDDTIKELKKKLQELENGLEGGIPSSLGTKTTTTPSTTSGGKSRYIPL
ncbi:MAG: coiled-coil domain-containing protein [Candidatus Helarchaeota archaeon]